MFSCELCEISKIIFTYRTPPVAASGCIPNKKLYKSGIYLSVIRQFIQFFTGKLKTSFLSTDINDDWIVDITTVQKNISSLIERGKYYVGIIDILRGFAGTIIITAKFKYIS